MTSLSTRPGKNIKLYNVETGTYEFRNVEGLLEGTQLTCKKCKQSPFNIKGIYSNLDDIEKKRFNALLNTNHARHTQTCPNSDSGSDEPNEPLDNLGFSLSSRIEDWTSGYLQTYLEHGGTPPEIANIVKVQQRPGPFGMYSNPVLTCEFRQPGTGFVSNELEISSTLLWKVGSAEYRESIDKYIEKFKVKEEVSTCMEQLIRTLEKEDDYKLPPKKKYKVSVGLFQRRGVGIKPQNAYEALLRMLTNEYAKGGDGMLGITPTDVTKCFLDRFNLTDFAYPTTVYSQLLEETMLAFQHRTKRKDYVRLEGKKLYIKPTALHAWLLILASRYPEPVKLAVTPISEKVENDIYGFTNVDIADISLSFEYKSVGILCAVIGEGERIDRHLVLPLGLIG